MDTSKIYIQHNYTQYSNTYHDNQKCHIFALRANVESCYQFNFFILSVINAYVVVLGVAALLIRSSNYNNNAISATLGACVINIAVIVNYAARGAIYDQYYKT